MFCAPKFCILSQKACLYNRQIALRAIQKLLQGEAISYFEIDRLVAFKGCKHGNHDLAESAIQAMFDKLAKEMGIDKRNKSCSNER